MKIIIHWMLSSLALLIATYIISGVSVETPFVALVAAVVIGILNVFIRPVLVIFTLPINVLTLGLFTFVINAFIILLTSKIVDGFKVEGFWWAVLFSFVLSIVNWFFHRFEQKQKYA